MYKSFSMNLAGRTLTVDIGRVAKQANGAAFMHYGDTTLPVSYTHLLLCVCVEQMLQILQSW